MSPLPNPTTMRRRLRKIDAGQLVFLLIEPSFSRELPEFENRCPRCGAPNFVHACGRRCCHCGFAPSCDD